LRLGPLRKTGGEALWRRLPLRRHRLRLEIELHRKLDDAGSVHGPENGGTAVCHVDNSIVAQAKSREQALFRCLGALEGRMVEDIEELGTELEAGLLGDLGLLNKRHIPVLLERSSEDIARHIAYSREARTTGTAGWDHNILVVYTVASSLESRQIDIAIYPVFNAARQVYVAHVKARCQCGHVVDILGFGILKRKRARIDYRKRRTGLERCQA